MNLVVDVAVRGTGVGQALMAAAMHLATTDWDAQKIYTHVDSQNEVCDCQTHNSQRAQIVRCMASQHISALKEFHVGAGRMHSLQTMWLPNVQR